MKLFELRACWEEFYDDPEDGTVKVCDTYDTVAFEVNDVARLRLIAAELERGFEGKCRTLPRCKRLCSLYQGYDDMRDTQYRIVEVTDLIVNDDGIARDHQEAEPIPEGRDA